MANIFYKIFMKEQCVQLNKKEAGPFFSMKLFKEKGMRALEKEL